MSFLQIRTFKKGDYLLQAGKICSHKHFILEGLVKTSYLEDSGTERIVQFALENWWVLDWESFVHEKPATTSIQALEATRTLTIDKASLEDAYQKIPKLESLFRKITENWLIAVQRNKKYMMASSQVRYNTLVKSLPNIVQRVPQYMLASYLDITPEYLSELRKKHS